MRRLAPYLLTLLASRATAEEPSLATLLPPDTPVYVEIKSPSAEEMAQLAMARVFDDPRMKALLERAHGDDSSFQSMRLPMGDAMLSLRTEVITAEDVLIDVSYMDADGERTFRIRNRLAFALADLPAGPLPIDAVVAVETDSEASRAAAIVERIVAAAALHARGVEDGDIEAEQARLIQHAEHRGLAYAWADVGPMRLCLAPLGRLLVLAASEERMKDVLDRSLDGTAPSLATDPRHTEMLASVPGGGTATTQIALHIDRVVAKLQANYPQVGATVLGGMTMVGLRDLESVTTVARVAGEGIRANTRVVLAPAERRAGLGRLFEKAGPPPSLGGFDFAPVDSYYVNCGNVDLQGLYRGILEVGGMGWAMVAQMRLQQDFGLRLKEDLIDLIGPEVTIIVSPNRGLVPDVGIICSSTDPVRLERNLLQLLSKIKWPAGQGVSHFKLRDVEVHAVPLGHPDLGVPLAPTFGVVDGYLVMTPFPLSFQRYLAVKRGDRPALARNPDYAKLRKMVPPNAQGVSYLDLARIFELAYDTFVPFVQAMSQSGLTSRLYEFPDVETLSQHLFGRIAWRTADERGLQWQSYASVDTSSFTLSLVAGASVALYYVREADVEEGEIRRPEAVVAPVRTKGPPHVDDEESQCRYRTQMIRGHLTRFRREHGRLPATLAELTVTRRQAEVFIVPGTAEKPYVYLGPDAPGRVLLHGYPNGDDGKICMIDKDLRIARVSAEVLEKLKAGSAGR